MLFPVQRVQSLGIGTFINQSTEYTEQKPPTAKATLKGESYRHGHLAIYLQVNHNDHTNRVSYDI